MLSFEDERKKLVEYMQSTGVLKNERIKNAFLSVHRENFVLSYEKEQAYLDTALPLIHNQTISQPSTIAIMLEMLNVEEGNKVLEIGLGSGYVAALLSKLVGESGTVYAVERIKELVDFARKNLEKEKINNVKIFCKDGSLGLEEYAPFDRILISCAVPSLPKPLADQVVENGIIVAPIGSRFCQFMTKFTKKNGKLIKEVYQLSTFVFVPLIGEFGFREI
ncbi:protein-L-isoaspartate O-methyltransferase [Candidatus Woesearchaeota archaeon]|nr:MAG: protein-L-isoaspartate O-methyltransferase [Candidatus Woesearchaeota archaeon]